MKILLHGALGSGKQLEPVAGLLRGDVLIYTFTGHGGNTVPAGGFEMTSLADDFYRWLVENDLYGVDVFGYSMGGYIALLVTRAHPERIRHVLTLGTKFDWSPESAARETRQLQPDFLLEKAPGFVDHLRILHGDHWKSLLDATASMMTRLGSTPLLTDHSLSMIQHPVVVARGAGDRMVTERESRSAALALTDARYEEIPDWPHSIDRIPADELAKLIARILL